jgi:hypothetical protein
MLNISPAVHRRPISSPNRISALNFHQNITSRYPGVTAVSTTSPPGGSRLFLVGVGKYLAICFLTTLIIYLSLITTSAPVSYEDLNPVKRAIAVLEKKGFNREAFLLRNMAVYRSSNSWLNGISDRENAYAATNFPFEIITLYPDFYTKATDDTERAMILLHEAQHLQGADEMGAYSYVWQNRARLGWTRLKYGTTDSYITIEELTRAEAPALFSCKNKIWSDCTETLFVKK